MPIHEYEKDALQTAEPGRVRIEIRSRQHDLTNTGFFGVPGGEAEPEFFDELLPPELFEDSLENDSEEGAADSTEENSVYTLLSEGTLRLEDGRVTLSYIESALTDMEGCVTTISFDPENPSCVTITRSGDSINTAFVIEQRVRQFSVYRTPYGPIEMCIFGKNVQNSLTLSGGELLLDYAVELKGMTTQRTKMSIQVTPC